MVFNGLFGGLFVLCPIALVVSIVVGIVKTWNTGGDVFAATAVIAATAIGCILFTIFSALSWADNVLNPELPEPEYEI